MSDISVKKLASAVGIKTERLIQQLNEAGISVSNETDTINDQQKLLLLKQLKRDNQAENNIKTDITLDDILSADSLLELNDLLTRVMVKQQIQALIKDHDLAHVTDSIISLANNASQEAKLFAAAMMGRLAAVARGREIKVFERVKEIITTEPPSLDTLSDELDSSNDKDVDLGKTKQYAAQSLRYIDAAWVSEYCLREAVNIDTARNARRELLDIALCRCGSVSTWLIEIANESSSLNTASNIDTRINRVRRLFEAMLSVVTNWQSELGDAPGPALGQCLSSLAKGKLVDVDQEVLYELIDNALGILARMIELRFSYALYGETYAVMEEGKAMLGAGMWGRYLDKSRMITKIRTDILESALVLARQNRTDKSLMDVLIACYTSKSQMSAAVKRHFYAAMDLEPSVYEWWQSAGKNTGDGRHVEHKVGNTEDEQIGALLIEVESAKETMDKLNRAVAPMLEISDPVLAETVKAAANRYIEMAQIARRLSRMRKLTRSDLMGQRLEYNPREHEMRGGHKPGIRLVRVVRDGIRKEFNRNIKTLVKPLVEPDE